MRWIMLLTSVLLVACAGSPEETLRAEDRYVILDTGRSRIAEGIFPVVLTRIDERSFRLTADDLARARGGLLPRARYTHQVAPGPHTLEAVALVDRRYVPGVKRDASRGDLAPLTEVFQSGRRYFIGVEAKSSRSADWRLVIWKVEDTEAGTLDLGEP